MPPALARPDSEQTVRLLDRVRAGDRQALEDLLAEYRDGLRVFVDLHLDPAVRGRVDASDVVQDAQLEMARRLPDYLARQPMPFHVWARKTAYERVLNVGRYHRADRRDVAREAAAPDASSVRLAERLVAAGPTPSQAAEVRERAAQVAAAVEGLPAADREVLLMRHVEGLPYEEIGALLDVDPAAARQRYGRALIRLERALAGLGVSGGAP